MDDLGSPDRIGLLLPLHWQTVALLLAGVATGATVALVEDPGALAGCSVAFVTATDAEAALDAGVDDVLALSGHPLGAPAGDLPQLVLDYAREVPGHGDHFGGAAPRRAHLEADGRAVVPAAGLSAGDRVLTSLPPAHPLGAGVLLGALTAGASLVLLCEGDAAGVAAAEHVTHTAGLDLPGLTRTA